MFRRRMIMTGGSKIPPNAVDKSNAALGYICISDGENIGFMSLADWQNYTGTDCQAIGVVAGAVGDCNDDLVRVCSLHYMNCSTPDVGRTSSQLIYWNGYNTSIGGGITQTTDEGIAESDYNGKTNTTAILTKATAQSDWRTASTITNSSSSSTNKYFPAACCCWRYHTLGTQQGDWYLPACGELLLIKDEYMERNAVVNSSLQALGAPAINDNEKYWSSTSYSNTKAWAIVWDGWLEYNRNTKYSVRAFIAF